MVVVVVIVFVVGVTVFKGRLIHGPRTLVVGVLGHLLRRNVTAPRHLLLSDLSCTLEHLAGCSDIFQPAPTDRRCREFGVDADVGLLSVYLRLCAPSV